MHSANTFTKILNKLNELSFLLVDRLHIHKEWMDMLVEMIIKLNNHSAYVGDGCEHQLDNVISRKHTMFKFNLLSMMDDKWYPGRLPYLLPDYMNMLRVSISSVILYDCHFLPFAMCHHIQKMIINPNYFDFQMVNFDSRYFKFIYAYIHIGFQIYIGLCHKGEETKIKVK